MTFRIRLLHKWRNSQPIAGGLYAEVCANMPLIEVAMVVRASKGQFGSLTDRRHGSRGVDQRAMAVAKQPPNDRQASSASR